MGTNIREVIEVWVANRNTASIPLRVSPQVAALLARLLTDYRTQLDERAKRELGHANVMKRLHDLGDPDFISTLIEALEGAVWKWDEENPRPFWPISSSVGPGGSHPRPGG